MKDELEDFIRKNRDGLDDLKPSARVWARIEKSIFGSRSWSSPVVLWRAAAIFFMALSAYLLIPRHAMESKNTVALKEFSDVEAFYAQEISNKVDLIRQFKRDEGLNGFTEDFRQLEAMYAVLKEELKARPTEQVKDALVLNLLVRIDLLNQHIEKLEEARTHERKKIPERKA
jgi:hypothetical protein